MEKLLIVLSFCALSSLGQIPSNVPLNGLMGYWPLSGNANDVSGFAYHGTIYGAQPALDRFNNAACSYSFNGVSDYIITPYQGILGSNARAVSFWGKTSEMTNVITGVAWGSNTTGNRFGCGLNYGSSGVTIGAANGAITYLAPSPVYDDQWHHYVFQFGASSLPQVEVYQDAVLLTQSVHTFNQFQILNTLPGFNVQFGRVDYSSPDYFKGQLDDIGIWNRTLTQSEILQLFNGLAEKVTESTASNIAINLYPNPASENVFLICDKKVSIEIYNVLGEKVFSSNNIQTIDCRSFNRGTYFVIARYQNTQQVKKLVLAN